MEQSNARNVESRDEGGMAGKNFNSENEKKKKKIQIWVIMSPFDFLLTLFCHSAGQFFRPQIQSAPTTLVS